MLEIPIFKCHPEAQLPAYATEGSACFDLHSVEPVTLAPGQRGLVPIGIIVDLPEHTMMLIYPRSGLAMRYGLTTINAVGVVDSDYTSEIMVAMVNLGGDIVNLPVGTRVAQACIMPIRHVGFKFAENPIAPKKDRRGGFGSTGLSDIQDNTKS